MKYGECRVRVVVGIIIASMLIPYRLFAEVVPSPRIALPIRPDQRIDEVLCVAKSSGAVVISPGIYNLLENTPSVNSSTGGLAMVGCSFGSPLDVDGTISVIVNRSGTAPKIFGVRAETVVEYESLLDSDDKARQRLVKQREVLNSYQVQTKTQERALVRLRSDADLIGSQTGFVQAEAQFKALSSEVVALDRELQNIESSIVQIKSQPAPANGAAREIENTKQLAELAQVARGAEQSQVQQQNSANSELSASMRLIEETRFDQPDQIRAELVKVRRRRQELEETLQDHTQSAVDYE